MKKLLVLALSIFMLNGLVAQPWMKNIPQNKLEKGEYNFYDIQKAFHEYWSKVDVTNPENIRGAGYKPFRRWETFMAPRVYPHGNLNLPTEILWKENEKKQNYRKAKEDQVADWTAMGPFEVPLIGSRRRGNGRVNCIAFHPTNEDIMYVGAPAGGIWRTTDAGETWKCLTHDLLSLGVSAIVINHEDPNIIYIATGDGDATDTYSIGILKSTDGGDTWNPTGFALNTTQNVQMRRMVMHPTDPKTMWVTTSKGVVKTTDGFENFTIAKTGNFKDIAIKPSDPTVLYATDFKNYGGASIYKSTDGGDTWAASVSGITTSNVLRTAIAVSANDPEVVYALCAKTDNGLQGIYKSTDSGASWTKTYTGSVNLLSHKVAGGNLSQGFYDLAIDACPTDANTVVIGGIIVWKSTDGGVNWEASSAAYSPDILSVPYAHADVHEIHFSPFGKLYAGNDGGLYRSPDKGDTWEDITDGLAITQIARMSTSATNPGLNIIGTQDNGTLRLKDGVWSAIMGGDGMECIIDYTNANTMYASIYNGDIRKSTSGGSFFYSLSIPETGEGAWITPYLMDPTDHNTLYVGISKVYKSTDAGKNWSTISPTLAGQTWYALTSLTVAPSNTNYIYAAKSNNQIWVTKTGGGLTSSDWTSISSGISGAITYICVSPTNPEKAWVSVSGYSSTNKVFMTEDAGATWTNYSTGIPNVPVNCVVAQKDSPKEILYAGTDLGVYYRDNTMTEWKPYSEGLPNVVVRELDFQYETGRLRAGTYGRGLWETPMINTLAANFTASNNNPDFGATVNFTDASNGTPASWAWEFEGGTPATSTEQNPNVTYSAAGSYDVTLTITDADGNSKAYTKKDFIVVKDNQSIENIARSIKVYPNPASNFVKIELENISAKNTKIRMFNQLGKNMKVVSTKNDKTINVDLGNVQSGIYFLHIDSPNKKIIKKIVVNK